MRPFTSIRRYKLKLVGKDPTSHRSLRAVFVGVLIPGLIDRIIGDPDNFRGSVRLGIGTIDRATRSGMEPVVNSTVKMSRNG